MGTKTKSKLKQVRKTNENNKVTKIYQKWEDIKMILPQYNKQYFSKAKNTNVYNNKLTKSLCKNEVRNKILNS